MNRSATAAHGAELIAVAAVTGAANFACIVYAGRKLQPSEYADFWTALSIVFVLTMLLNPLAPFASHVASSVDDIGAVAAFRRVAMRRLAWLAAGVLIAGLALAPWVSTLLHFRSISSLIPAVATIAVYGFLVTDRGLLQGLHRFRSYNINTAIESALRLAGTVGALAFASTAASAMTAYFGGAAIAELMLLRAIPGPAADIDPPDAGSIALPIFVLLFGTCVFQNIDTFAVKHWLPALAADYSAAAVFSRISTALVAPLYVLLIPAIARERSHGKPTDAAIRICGSYLALSILLLSLLAILAQPLSTGLLGPQYRGAARLIVPITGMLTIVNLTLLATQTLVSLGRTRVLFVYVAIAILEVAGLFVRHGSISEILSVLYAGAIVLLVAMFAMLALQRRGPG
jgi:O-antigen/teichoic acid export membrane protein